MVLIPTTPYMCVGRETIPAYALSQGEILALITKRPEVSCYFVEDGAQSTERHGVAASQPADGVNGTQPGTGDESEQGEDNADIPALDE